MSKPWPRRSLKLRLTLWYAGVTALVIAVFSWVTYEVVEHRLGAELDRQLRIDFDLIEARLDADPSGNIRWLVQGAHGDEGFARLSAWFEVWSEEGTLLFRHWPVKDADIREPQPAPEGVSLRFHTVALDGSLHVRLMERPARVQGRGVIVRVFRDESSIRRTLAQIVEVFLLAMPLAVVLASLGGYFIANRSLQPIAAMAAQARKITSESLGERLPMPHPEDELGQLAGVFNQTLERLERSFAELRRFTADASHELRTPLTALRAVGEVALTQQNSPAASREAIGSMLEEAGRLNDLVEALLTLARMEGGKVTIARASIALTEIVAEVIESLGVLALENGQRFVSTGEGGVIVNADRLLLRQALMNVVHNAIRYAHPNTAIAIRTGSEEGCGFIEVSDNGPGIAPEHLPRIFDRFYRVDASRSRGHGGTGLGLAIARWSIECQGGRIEVQSAIGIGTTFRLLLPR